MAATIELPDGSLILPPDPRRVRLRRTVLAAVTLLAVVAGTVVEAGTLQSPQITWADRLLPFALIAVVAVILWFGIRLPSLKADATEVRIGGSPIGSPQQMQRSELALIFRCQMLRPERYGSIWDRCYAFVSSDGTVSMSFWSFAFADDGVAEFAQRLHVPIRGDFTTQVNYGVDLAST